MFLSITLRGDRALELGYLVHKSPQRVHVVELPFGKASIFYTKLESSETTISMQVEVDAVGLVKKYGTSQSSISDTYVNDRPYVSSSMMSLALSKSFGAAMGGRSKERPALAKLSLPLEISIAALSSSHGEGEIRELFEPLGYCVELKEIPFRIGTSQKESSRYFNTTFKNTIPLSSMLKHLYLLLPVLDGSKHYWIHGDEVAKLLSKGEGWLENHPSYSKITKRYLKYQKSLLSQLDQAFAPSADLEPIKSNAKLEPSLQSLRVSRMAQLVKDSSLSSVLDAGCGSGQLLEELLKNPSLEKIGAVDISEKALARARLRIHYEELSDHNLNRLSLFHGSILYRDERWKPYEVMVLSEVIEHIELERLHVLEKILFGTYRPKLVLISTPLVLEADDHSANPIFRHSDHRFEWTAEEFEQWASKISSEYGYTFRIEHIQKEGNEGFVASQLGVFQL